MPPQGRDVTQISEVNEEPSNLQPINFFLYSVCPASILGHILIFEACVGKFFLNLEYTVLIILNASSRHKNPAPHSFDQSFSIFTKMTSAEEEATALKNQGNKAFAAHNWPEAIEYYTKAIALNDKEPTYYSNRAQVFSCRLESNLLA